MDNFREKIIERKKVKNPINFPELNTMKEIHNILLSFNPEKIKKIVQIIIYLIYY